MRHRPPAVAFHQVVHKPNRIAFHDDVKVLTGVPQQQIAHKAPDNISLNAGLGCFGGNQLQERLAAGWQGFLQEDGHFLLAGELAAGKKRAQQVGAGNDADYIAALRINDRHLAPAAGSHQRLQPVDGVLWCDAYAAGIHQTSGCGGQFVLQRPVYVPAGEQSHQFSVFHYRVAFKPIAPHQFSGGFNGGLSVDQQWLLGHNLPHAQRWADDLGQVSHHLLGDAAPMLRYVILGCLTFGPDQRRSGPLMPAAAKMFSQLTHVDIIGGRACDQAHPLTGGDQHDQAVWIKKFAQFVGNRRDFIAQVQRVGFGKDDLVPFHIVGGHILEQAVKQKLLGIGKRRIQVMGSQAQVGSLFQKVCSCVNVAGSRAGVDQRPGILVNAQEQQGGLIHTKRQFFLTQLFHNQRRASTGRLNFSLPG